MTKQHAGAPWLVYVLGALCVGAAATAFLVVGPPAQSAAASRTAVVGRGVVQSTVSASGNLTAANQTNVDFKVSGALAEVYARVGEHVSAGKLLAELDPDQAQTALTVAEDNLRSAEDRLEQAEGEGSSGSSSPTATTSAATTSPSMTDTAPTSETTATSPSPTKPAVNARPKTKASTPSKRKTTQPSTTQPNEGDETSRGSSGGSESAVGKAATVASDQAQVESARASVLSAEQSLAETKLYAPNDGTVASIAAETPGTAVSAGAGGNSGSSSASGGSSSSSSGASGSGLGGGGASSAGGSSGASSVSGASSSGSSSGSSASGFIVLVDTSSMQLVVPLSESDITKVKVGQVATVTVNALPTEKLAAKVTSIALLSTTSSGVVSYDVTLQLEQSASGLRPGMTASAQIVVAQAENAVNVTSSAISGRGATATVTVLRNGKDVRQQVILGLAGDSTTQVLNGLSPGEEVVVPIASGLSLGSGTTGRTGAFGAGGLGGGGLGGGGAGGGGGRFFGGGGVGG
jgi:multidrug efflux pump subunit AcrA (membrane-fusion protein)